MFRIRRYRVFVLVALALVAALYLLSNPRGWPSRLPASSLPFSTSWSPAAPDRDLLTSAHTVDTTAADAAAAIDLPPAPAKQGVLQPQQQQQPPPPEDEHPQGFPRIQLPGAAGKEGDVAQDIPRLKEASAPKARPVPVDHPAVELPIVSTDQDVPEAALANNAATTTSAVVHWTQFPERHPVTSYIGLPTGRPHAMPKIQYGFGEEDPAFTKTRNRRKQAVKEAFLKHWEGYKKFAWGHDELKPSSGSFKDPFAGWGATLVDSLDTMWMMGLEDEFEEAVRATAKIDFTTTPYKSELPLFEVTIRYLGGLLSAFDIAGQRHKVLLQKAVELGNLLYGAFDTENRMPITYYRWQPYAVPLYHRASSSVVLAELGTLSMEFTRLAQLTGDDKYYDAVARVTNELHKWQNHTRLPGLWPTYIDASRCDGKDPWATDDSKSTNPGLKHMEDEHSSLAEAVKALAPDLRLDSEESLTKFAESLSQHEDQGTNGKAAKGKAAKGIVADPRDNMASSDTHAKRDETPKMELPADYGNQKYCEKVGLRSSMSYDSFTLGGMADSVYEYLPKEFLLLGGLNTQYQDMYATAMAAIEKYLVYRPMISDESRQLRFTGSFRTDGTKDDDGRIDGTLEEKTGHLGCFLGGMVGMGARLFEREHDMELAAQLTDACVWAYQSTDSGIMAEDMRPVVCPSMASCPWNQTAWFDAIDPSAKKRVEAEHRSWEQAQQQQQQQPAAGSTDETLRAVDEALNAKRAPPPVPKIEVAAASEPGAEPRSYDEYMQERVQRNHLAPGVAAYASTNYLLRPEAIESVFYMWRLTGDRQWHNKGWDMWQAIEKHTRAEHGYSALRRVHLARPEQDDSAESFWTGETLKYFYLLFDEPWQWSLDDWVLNTEAHPFQIPKPGGRRTAAKNVFQGPGTPILRVEEPK